MNLARPKIQSIHSEPRPFPFLAVINLARFLRFLFVSLPLLGLLSVVWPVVSFLFWISGYSPERQLELGRRCAKIFLNALFLRVRYVGLENFHGVGPCVLVANHPSVTDVPALYGVPSQGSIFAAKQLFFNPLLCIQLRTGHHLPLGGWNGRDSIASIRRALDLITKRGKDILIFPESPPLRAKLQSFQEGAAFVAIMAGATMIPIALSGTRQLLGGTVTVRVGEPIPTVGLQVSDRRWLTTHLRDRVSGLARMEIDTPTEPYTWRDLWRVR
jgi:1-acyl-sn-glycerol-3-phosphate acyltransferase